MCNWDKSHNPKGINVNGYKIKGTTPLVCPFIKNKKNKKNKIVQTNSCIGVLAKQLSGKTNRADTNQRKKDVFLALNNSGEIKKSTRKIKNKKSPQEICMLTKYYPSYICNY